MLSLDDPRWQQLSGGYRIPFDPRPLLIQIERDPSPKNWGLLAEELFHQGDIGDAHAGGGLDQRTADGAGAGIELAHAA